MEPRRLGETGNGLEGNMATDRAERPIVGGFCDWWILFPSLMALRLLLSVTRCDAVLPRVCRRCMPRGQIPYAI